MNRQTRARNQKRDQSRQSKREPKPLAERQVSAHSHLYGELIAEATGTNWEPAHMFDYRDGGGVIYDFAQKTKQIRPTGAYGR